MTEAFVQIVAARLQGPARDSFTAFLEAKPELLSDAAAVLARYYSDSRLLSEQARQQWLEPDREAINRITSYNVCYTKLLRTSFLSATRRSARAPD